VRAIWAAGFLLRRLRAEPGVILLVVALVGITTFLFAGAPRLFNLVADEGLRRELDDASPAQRNIEISREFVVPTFNDPLSVLERLGQTELTRFPDTIRPLVTSQELVATTARFFIEDPPRYPTYLTLRHQGGVDDAIRLVDGRMPESAGEPLPPTAFGAVSTGSEPPDERPTIEVAMSQATAGEIGLAVGDELAGRLDETDALVSGTVARPLPVRFEVVGIFAIDDPLADFWYSDNALNEASQRGTDDNPVAFATALVAPDAVADLVPTGLALRYAWRYHVDPDRIDAGQLDALEPDLRRLATQYSTSSIGSDRGRIVLRTGLIAAIDRYRAERAASEAVLSIAAIGPIALAGGAIGMTAVLLIARRRANLMLARGRGASWRLILGAQLWEAVLLAGAAAIAGYLLATSIVPGRGSGLSAGLALATGLGAIAVLVAATWPVARRPLDHGGRDEPPPIRTSPRRLVFELTAVVIAVAGIGLLQQRGLSGGDSDAGGARFDPFLAAVPLLTGFAIAVMAVRLYPLPIRALGWLAARRRDLVPVLGLRNVGRRPSFANLPLLILMLTAAFGSFASVVMASVERGQVEASWAGVGADYRIERDGSLARVDPGAVPGVEAVAPAYVDLDAVFESAPNQAGRIRLEALDPESYRTVVAGSPIEPVWPAGFAAPGGGATGSADDPIPAIVSVRLPAGGHTLSPNEVFPIEIGSQPVMFEVVGRRPSFPGIPPGQPFVVAPLEPVRSAAPGGLDPNALFVRGPESLATGLGALLAEQGPSARVASRHAWYADLQGAPLIAVVANGFRLALLAAAGYAALAVVAALTLTASRRSQDLAFLRTLGLSGRQAVGVTIVEHGTPVLIALVPGIAAGVAIATLLESSLGLGAFIGPEAAFRVHVDWAGITLVGGSLMILVAVAIGASTWLARRARAVDALRAGEA